MPQRTRPPPPIFSHLTFCFIGGREGSPALRVPGAHLLSCECMTHTYVPHPWNSPVIASRIYYVMTFFQTSTQHLCDTCPP